MANMNKNRKFKNFFIYPQFQTRLILMILGISLIAPLVIFCFQFYSFQIQISNGQMMNLPDTHPYFVFYNEFKQASFFVFCISISLSFLLSLIIGTVVSHRIAGPLVKLRQHLEKVSKDPSLDTKINFREGDFFLELAEAYNLKFKKNTKS